MSEMPPRTYLWQLADFNNIDSSLLWEDTDEITDDQGKDTPPINSSLIEEAALTNGFEQSGPSETEYEI